MRTAQIYVTLLAALTLIEPAFAGTLKYEPAVVELAGILMTEERFGPPNYGEAPEHDSKVQILILQLAVRASVVGDPNDPLNSESVEDVREVQLAGELVASLRGQVGRSLKLRGTLFHAITGHHYTDVLMTVTGVVP